MDLLILLRSLVMDEEIYWEYMCILQNSISTTTEQVYAKK